MLSLHGLVVIATEITKEIPFEYTTILKFEVASEAGDGKMQRHYIDLFTPRDKVAEVKSKIRVGVVCEITHGIWSELASNRVVEGNAPRYSKVELKVESRNIKFLTPCIYYEDIENVTTTKKE